MSYKIKIAKDKKVWEDFISGLEYSSVFLSWVWAEFEKGIGSEFFRYAIYDDEDHMVGVLPVKVVRALRGDYLHLRHGPVIDWNNKKLAQKVLDFLKQMTHKHSCSFFRISPLIKDESQNRALLQEYGFLSSTAHMVDAEKTLIIDLTKSLEDLKKDMRKNTRYNVRKSKREGIEVRHVGDLSLFDEFTEIYKDTVERQGWSAYSVSYIKSEYEVFSKNNMARMFVAYHDNQPIAASIFLFYQDEVVYHHSGSLTEFRDLPSSYGIQWEVMKYAKKQNYKKYNLWGVCEKEKKEHPWYGLSLFKYGFGGKVRRMIHVHDYIVRPFGYLTMVYTWLENKLRGY
jgi:lipid II:glycine glycyltransferase (peptidoglycan interpeptide bridge formation enzyme)